jgi:mannosyltransferase
MLRQRFLPFTAGLMLALGIGLRLWRITGDPLWLDEAYSAYAADHGFAFLWQVVPRYETHPPFYYSLLRLWTMAFGDGLMALRLMGVVAGLATLPVVAWAAAEAGALMGWPERRRRVAMLVALALASVAPLLIEMSRQVRPYPIMILVYAAATMLLLRLAGRARGGQPIRGRAFALYLVVLEAMLWLHNLGPLYAVALTVALGIAVAGRIGRGDVPWLAGGHLMAGLLYLPGFLILLGQAPTWADTTWLRFAVNGLFLDRLATIYAVQGWPVIAAALLAGLSLATLGRDAEGRRIAAMLLILAWLPVMLAVILSLTVAPVFITRTMTAAGMPFLLLLALGVAGSQRRRIAVVAALVLGGAMIGASVSARSRGPMQDWYATVGWLRQHVRPGDTILAYPNEGALPLAYALRDRQLDYPVRPIPTPVPSFNDDGGRYPTGSRGVVSLPPDRLAAIADAPETRRIPTIWLLRLGRETYDPGDTFLTLLRRDRYVVRSWRAGPIDIVGLRRRPVPAPDRR